MLRINPNAEAAAITTAAPFTETDAEEFIYPYDLLADIYLSHITDNRRSDWVRESSRVRNINDRWWMVPLNEINPQDIAQWLNDLTDAGVAPREIKMIRKTFRRSYEMGRKWNVPGAVTNPVRNVTRRFIAFDPATDA